MLVLQHAIKPGEHHTTRLLRHSHHTVTFTPPRRKRVLTLFEHTSSLELTLATKCNSGLKC